MRQVEERVKDKTAGIIEKNERKKYKNYGFVDHR